MFQLSGFDRRVWEGQGAVPGSGIPPSQCAQRQDV